MPSIIEWRKAEAEAGVGVGMPCTTYLADDIHGWVGLIQLLGSKFSIAWGLIFSIVTFLVGLKWHEILNYFFKTR